jgi:hypothetical protein
MACFWPFVKQKMKKLFPSILVGLPGRLRARMLQ